MLSSVIIFVIVLLFYLHLMSQFKTSEDLEIYETDYVSNRELDEICNLRQPVLFEFKSHFPDMEGTNGSLPLTAEWSSAPSAQNPPCSIVVNVRDTTETETIRLPFESALTLMKTDKNSRFTSENNSSIPINEITRLDAFLKPPWVVHETTDVIFGSNGATTPLQYHTNHRTFMCVRSGYIRVKMTPYKSRKYAGAKTIPDNPNKKMAENETDERMRFLEFDVQSGYVLYVPSRWYYSIQLFDDAQVCGITYNTVFSLLPGIVQSLVA
jgi:hypothetical protein